MWLDQYEIDFQRIRVDLEDLYTDMVKSMNKDLKTELWGPAASALPTAVARRTIERRVTGPDVLGKFADRLQLDPEIEPIVRLGFSAFVSPEGQRFASAFVHQFFAVGPSDIPAAMAAFRRTLPAPIAAILEGAESDWTAHAGLLAHPDGFENPLLVGIQQASDETLLNLRDVAKLSNVAWVRGCELAIVTLGVRPDVLGNFRLLTPVLARILSRMARRPLFRSPSARVVLLALAVASSSVRSNQGRKLVQLMRLIVDLGDWLTKHPEVIKDFERLTNERWHALMMTSDFPTSARELILAAELSGAGTA